MALTISQRFYPYSHKSGTLCLLPGTHLACKVFVSRVELYDYSKELPSLIETLDMSHFGPLDKFLVQQDLEHGKIVVSGFSSEGFIRYPLAYQPTLTSRERLFLGVDKSQEWQQVVRRMDMREIVPYLYMLAQSVPDCALEEETGPSLIRDLQDARPSEVEAALEALFKAGFSDLLVPRLIDTDYHGYKKPIVSVTNKSPLYLLKVLYPLLRSLFIEERDGLLHILPKLPPKWVSGTLTDCTTANGHKISIEWTKGFIRRVKVTANSCSPIQLAFQKEVKKYRSWQSENTTMYDNFLK